MHLEPIGIVKSRSTEAVDTGWGQVISEIHVNETCAEGLIGLDLFSHAVVVFFMHESSFDASSPLTRRPRGRDDMPLLGIFAQRSKHRPNPIGITPVELLEVKDNIVKVQGLDAIDGTPVLDIKPYVPAFDRVENATVPEWIDRLMVGYF